MFYVSMYEEPLLYLGPSVTDCVLCVCAGAYQQGPAPPTPPHPALPPSPTANTAGPVTVLF